MHKIIEVHIENFRSCIDTRLSLSDFTPLVGYNNAGKSNILSAIKWLLKPYALSQTDFFDSENTVCVTGHIVGIDDKLLSLLDERHRTRIEPYCVDGNIRIRRIQNEPSTTVRDIKLEIRNPKITDEISSDAWVVNPSGISQAISALFPDVIEINAMEDAAEDVAKYKTSTTIGKLISEVMQPVEEIHGQSIIDALNDLRERFEATGSNRPPEIEEFDLRANRVLSEFFPGIKIKLHVPTPDVSQLFKTGTIKAFEDEDGECRDISALGNGAQRSIQMALVRYLADRKADAAESGSRQLLLVEEPELYLHPQAVEQIRVALKQLSQSGYQVIFSTHSPLPISSKDIPRTLLIRKTRDKGTHARQTLENAVRTAIEDAPSQARVLFSLSNSSQLLFSDKVVIAEGKTENILIPSLFELVQGRTLGLAKIALIGQGGVCNTCKSLEILHAMNIPSKAVVDLDFAFRNAISNGLLQSDDEDVLICMNIIRQIVIDKSGKLDGVGLPQKNGSISPAEVFTLLGANSNAGVHIQNIHEKLKMQNVWIWVLGDFDAHLGLDGKDESDIADYSERLGSSGFDQTVKDAQGVKQLIEWID